MTAGFQPLPWINPTPYVPTITTSYTSNIFRVPKLIEQRNEDLAKWTDITG